MAEKHLIMTRFMASLKTSWDGSNLGNIFTGGYYNGEPNDGPNTKRPYLVIDDVTETDQTFTSSGIYSQLYFAMRVVGDDPDVVATTLSDAAIQGIIDTVKVLSDDMKIVLPQRATVRYRQELNYHMAAIEYNVAVGRPR